MTNEVVSFINQLKSEFPHLPTAGQEVLLNGLSRFTYSMMPKCTLVVKGYAGTGKTTVIGSYVKVLKKNNFDVVLLAPTGRAAKVLSNYSGLPAFTIHKKIYQRKPGAFGASGYGLMSNRHRRTVFLVDEASMIGDSGVSGEQSFEYRSLLDDLIEYVFNGHQCKLVLIGDQAQLPPVGADQSPALDIDRLQSKQHLTIAELELTEVVRQEMDSGILFNATVLRNAITSRKEGFPLLNMNGFDDVKRISGLELQEVLEDLNGKYGREGVMVITRSNKRANLFNQNIRARIEWFEERLNAGDLLMVVRNNYHWLTPYKDAPTTFIANGDVVEVLKVIREYEMYDMDFADVEVQLIDYPNFQPFEVRIMLDSLEIETANLPQAQMKTLYHEVSIDYSDLGFKKKIHEAVMKDPFYNALQVKFAYSVTCHKSQGGQWPAVILDQGYLTEEMLNISLLRWFYTAITRAQTELYLLNFDPSFFGKTNEQ
ncbi:MAG: ATP-dependent DNA helicase [Flavobacteriales bacterium]